MKIHSTKTSYCARQRQHFSSALNGARIIRTSYKGIHGGFLFLAKGLIWSICLFSARMIVKQGSVCYSLFSSAGVIDFRCSIGGRAQQSLLRAHRQCRLLLLRISMTMAVYLELCMLFLERERTRSDLCSGRCAIDGKGSGEAKKRR